MYKKYTLFFSALLASTNLKPCTTCNKELQSGIYNSLFFPNLLIMLSAFFVLGLIVFFFSRLSLKMHRLSLRNGNFYSPAPLTTASVVLGIGLGGFIDGILLHQVLQWHEMLSNKISTTTVIGKSVNMFWDGVFHLFCLAVVFTGIILLWKLLFRKDVVRSGKLLCGGLLLGWGTFNLVEGIIDHQILQLHNVKEQSVNQGSWNLAFLLISALMVVAGSFIIYHKKHFKVLTDIN